MAKKCLFLKNDSLHSYKMVQTGEDDLVEYGFRRVIITITAVLCALFEIVDVTIVNGIKQYAR
jgi:DHA2 family multidrug resistance protein